MNCPNFIVSNQKEESISKQRVKTSGVIYIFQYHALGLLYHIRKHDRLAVNKLVSKFSKHSLKSPYAYCLLVSTCYYFTGLDLTNIC